MRVAEPIVEKLQDNISSLKEFEKEISNLNDEKLKDIILNFPLKIKYYLYDRDLFFTQNVPIV